MEKKLPRDVTNSKKVTVSPDRSKKSDTVKKNPSVVSDLVSIQLPKPALKRGLTVRAALKKRCTVRSIRDKKVSLQTVSNILWAAAGINRQKGPFNMCGRTFASASNSQEIDIYVTLPEGIYLYDASMHTIQPVASGDFRSSAISAGQKGAGANAPVRLVYVVDLEKFKNAGFQEPGLQDPETQKAYYFVDTGMIAGNVYLYAVSQGLAAWFHNCDRESLAKVLKLRPAQRILFGQTIGKPEKQKKTK
jgi:nitroreductase